jgi:hypothetical protein
MVTLDDLWFFFNMDHEVNWLQRDEEIPERE